MSDVMLWLDSIPLWQLFAVLIGLLVLLEALDEWLRIRRWARMTGRRWRMSRWGDGE